VRILKSNKVAGLLFLAYFFSLVFGNKLYIVAPAFSFMNILLPFIILLGMYYLFFSPSFQAHFIFVFILLSLYVLFAILITFFFRGEEQLKDLFYSFHLIGVLFAAYFLIRDKIFTQQKVFLFFFWLYQLLIFLSLFQALSTLGVVPQIWNSDIDNLKVLMAGPYANPNNLAVICLMFFMYLFWVADTLNKSFYKKVLFVSTLAILLVTLSRFTLVLFFLFFFFFLLFQKKYKIFMVLSLSLLVTLSSFFTILMNMDMVKQDGGDMTIVTRNFNRLIAIRDLFDSKNGSSDVRMTSYLYFFENLDKASLPVGTGNYSDFYNQATFDASLISLNPHSFWIEITLAYGFVALFLLLFMLFYMASRAGLNVGGSFCLLVILYFAFIVNIPSSILRTPVIWLPLFLVYFQSMTPYYVKKLTT